MFIDEYALIRMEQSTFPGNIGDSCAETFRALLLKLYINGYSQELIESTSKALIATRTEKGYLRHPLSPWREDDFSGDQWLPRYLVSALTTLDNGMVNRLKANKYRTGNGDFAGPILFAAIARSHGSRGFDFALYLQALVFKIPFRWSDSKHWFESSADSSADYLNWFMYLIYCETTGPSFWSKLARATMNPEVLRAKVRAYYASEPNCFVLPLYDAAIDKVWSKKYD